MDIRITVENSWPIEYFRWNTVQWRFQLYLKNWNWAVDFSTLNWIWIRNKRFQYKTFISITHFFHRSFAWSLLLCNCHINKLFEKENFSRFAQKRQFLLICILHPDNILFSFCHFPSKSIHNTFRFTRNWTLEKAHRFSSYWINVLINWWKRKYQSSIVEWKSF